VIWTTAKSLGHKTGMVAFSATISLSKVEHQATGPLPSILFARLRKAYQDSSIFRGTFSNVCFSLTGVQIHAALIDRAPTSKYTGSSSTYLGRSELYLFRSPSAAGPESF
jgi:hypothetical protein